MITMNDYKDNNESSSGKRPLDTSFFTVTSQVTPEAFQDRISESKEYELYERKCACASPKVWWWDPKDDPTSNSVDFCLDTSLHGLKYIGQPRRHMTERFFWLMAFGIGCLAAAYLIHDVFRKYVDSPVIVTFQPFETNIGQIPFPAVTICNMNKVLKSKAEEYIREAKGPEGSKNTIEARKNVYYLDHVCSSSRSFSKVFNYSSARGGVDPDILKLAKISEEDDDQGDVARFLKDASQRCDEMLPLCIWHGETRNCSELFNPIETDFGKCCTFNMIPQTLLHRYTNDTRDNPQEVRDWAEWDLDTHGLFLDEETNKEFPRRQLRAGKSSGLSILLNPALHEYFCTTSDSTGFRLATHLPIAVPHIVDFGIAVKPNSEVFMSVRPEITMADDDIRGFRLEKRNCYFRGEFQLGYYQYYTASNCLDECVANLTYEKCNCVRYYMPRDENRDLCGPANSTCAEDVRRTTTTLDIKKTCSYCRPTCTSLKYFTDATFTPIQKGQDIWVDDFNIPTKWIHNNVSIVHIFFGQDTTYARVRKELYGITDLIANTGGLMGLCLGFSGLSLVELLYFFTLRAWWRSRRRRAFWIRILDKFYGRTKDHEAHSHGHEITNNSNTHDK